ncbi:hypothetical protein RJ641_006728 [Dillenia turbinata]|uniref:Uncharacterized protein n=1 Tax=Dillenia turbinata TaxID=194707 RepID=A0AAN8VIU9_9MAGN
MYLLVRYPQKEWLAAKLASSRDCAITLIIANPTVSTAESDHISHFLSAYPGVKLLEFQLLPLDSTDPTSDPLFLQFGAISRSMNPVVQPLLSFLSPPLSAVFCDFGLAASFSLVAADLDIPYYVLVTTSA